jgi:membrane protease YdiL (CAAX protease family)
MSRITFLDNAAQGKNNWWRYLLTIILVWGLGFTGIFIISLAYSVYLIITGVNQISQLESTLLNSYFFLVITGIFFIIMISMLYVSTRFIHKRNFISLVNTDSKFDFRRFLKGAVVWSVIMLIFVLVSLMIDPSGIKFTFNPSGFIILLVLSLLIFPIQASFEELFFRGYLMQGIGLLTKKPIIPLIITSVIFALVHYGNGPNTMANIDIILQVFVMGITLGIIVLGENRLETAMGVHIANNIFVTVIINDPTSLFGELPSILSSSSVPNPLMDVPIMALLSVVLLVIIFWNKKENLYNIFRNES